MANQNAVIGSLNFLNIRTHKKLSLYNKDDHCQIYIIEMKNLNMKYET